MNSDVESVENLSVYQSVSYTNHLANRKKLMQEQIGVYFRLILFIALWCKNSQTKGYNESKDQHYLANCINWMPLKHIKPYYFQVKT